MRIVKLKKYYRKQKRDTNVSYVCKLKQFRSSVCDVTLTHDRYIVSVIEGNVKISWKLNHTSNRVLIYLETFN